MMVLLAALMAAAPAQAAVEGENGVLDKPAVGKRICRREVPTGSIMPGKLVCLTRSQWAKVSDVRNSRSDGFFNRAARPVGAGGGFDP